MKIYTEKVIPKHIVHEKTVRTLVQVNCDICQSNKDAGRDSYDAFESNIYMKLGGEFPEGGSGTEINVDICEKCFRTQLIPFLESLGVVVREEEWDW